MKNNLLIQNIINRMTEIQYQYLFRPIMQLTGKSYPGLAHRSLKCQMQQNYCLKRKTNN
jgi:hypothetical protein